MANTFKILILNILFITSLIASLPVNTFVSASVINRTIEIPKHDSIITFKDGTLEAEIREGINFSLRRYLGNKKTI